MDIRTRIRLETKTYNPDNNLLIASKTLYDAEGRAVVSVGPYEPNDANLPVRTENVYDVLGRVIETRRGPALK